MSDSWEGGDWGDRYTHSELLCVGGGEGAGGSRTMTDSWG